MIQTAWRYTIQLVRLLEHSSDYLKFVDVLDGTMKNNRRRWSFLRSSLSPSWSVVDQISPLRNLFELARTTEQFILVSNTDPYCQANVSLLWKLSSLDYLGINAKGDPCERKVHYSNVCKSSNTVHQTTKPAEWFVSRKKIPPDTLTWAQSAKTVSIQSGFLLETGSSDDYVPPEVARCLRCEIRHQWGEVV